MSDIKYEFALDKNKNRIHISEVDKKNIEKYTCYGCSKEMIPRKGDINAHHFAHKTKCKCSNKKYLHELAIETLYNSYQECLIEKKAFILGIINPKTGALEPHDITKHFPNVSKRDKRADIVLSNKNGSDIVLIDFTILNEKKIINRPITNRLIKINISSDEDIKNIVKNQFKYESKIQLYNFRNAYNSKNLEVDLHDNENNNTSQNTKKLYYIITKKNKEQIIGKATLKEIEDYIKLHKNEILSEYIHHEDK